MEAVVAFGVASSVFTVLGFAIQLWKDCRYQMDAKGECPGAIKLIYFEVENFNAILKSMDDIIKASADPRREEQRIKNLIGASLRECEQCLKQLKTLVPDRPKADKPKDSRMAAAKSKVIIFVDAFKWNASHKDKCDGLLKDLRDHKMSLSLNLAAGMSEDIKKIGVDVKVVKADVKEVKSTVNAMQASLNEAQKAEVYKWLEKINPSVNHNSAGHLHEKNTGAWLTRSDEWKNWLAGAPKSRFLWVKGNPGTGKTVLAYSMINYVYGLTKDHKSKAYSYYYCDHSRNQDETLPFLTWIISQFCRSAGGIPDILNKLHGSGHEPTPSQLLSCLDAVLTRFAEAYVVVDAIDEPKPPGNLLSVLAQLGADPRFGKLRLAVTSRSSQEIKEVFASHCTVVSMDNNTAVEADIQAYVKTTLMGPKYSIWGPQLQSKVATIVSQKANGLFRYASCQLEILGDCGNVQEVETRLTRMPETLEAMYEKILRSIKTEHRAFVIKALCLIVGTQEDTTAILSKALAQCVYGASSFHNIDTLKKQCIGLIRVRENDTVVLAHYTVLEFLHLPRLQSSNSLKDFALTDTKVINEYNSTILTTAQKFTGSIPSRVDMDREGNPTDFNLYSLARSRVAMFWNKDGLLKAPGSGILIPLLDPYARSFRGLQVLGSDGPNDSGNEVMFEWLAQYQDTGYLEQKAAHLTMIVGFERASLVKEYLNSLSKLTPEQKNALFTTQMKVLLPTAWTSYRRTGKMESRLASMTVVDFYTEGQKRGYDTTAKLDLLRTIAPKAAFSGGSSSKTQDTSSSHTTSTSHSHTAASTSGNHTSTSGTSGRPLAPPAQAQGQRDTSSSHRDTSSSQRRPPPVAAPNNNQPRTTGPSGGSGSHNGPVVR